MSDPFDAMFDGEPEPGTQEQQKRTVGLAVGMPLDQAAFEAKFVNRKFTPADYHVDFEVEDGKGGWIDASEAGK